MCLHLLLRSGSRQHTSTIIIFTKLHVSGRYIYILYSNVLNCIHLLAICFKLQLFIPKTKMVKARSFWRTHRGYPYAHGIVNALVMFLLIYHCSNFCLKIPWLDKMIYAPYCSLNPLVIEFTERSFFLKLVLLIRCPLYIHNTALSFDNFYETVKIGV